MGEEIGELEMEELIPKWGWREIREVDSRDKVKQNKSSDQYFLETMMSVAEQE